MIFLHWGRKKIKKMRNWLHVSFVFHSSLFHVFTSSIKKSNYFGRILFTSTNFSIENRVNYPLYSTLRLSYYGGPYNFSCNLLIVRVKNTTPIKIIITGKCQFVLSKGEEILVTDCLWKVLTKAFLPPYQKSIEADVQLLLTPRNSRFRRWKMTAYQREELLLEWCAKITIIIPQWNRVSRFLWRDNWWKNMK